MHNVYMALVWLPLDEAIIDSFCILARHPWDRASLDDTWRTSGLHSFSTDSVSDSIYEEMEYLFHVGDRLIRVSVDDNSKLNAFWTSFCLYYEPEGFDDPSLKDFLDTEQLPSIKWQLDKMGQRGEFNARWTEGCSAVEGRLGLAPDLVGVHAQGEENWGHSIWRIGPRLIVVMQGEDIGSYSLYEEAALWVVDFPVNQDLPHGDELYSLLVEGRI